MEVLNDQNQELVKKLKDDTPAPIKNPKAQEAAERVRKKNKGSMGRGSTLLTGPGGLLGSTSYEGTTLLGG